jgi:hypothetical protein
LAFPRGDGSTVIKQTAIDLIGSELGGRGKEFFEWNQEVGFFLGPTPVGGTIAGVFGTTYETGSKGIEFTVEDGSLDGL